MNGRFEKQWTDADIDRVLAVISTYTGKNLRDVCVKPLMPFLSLYDRARNDPVLHARVQAAIASREALLQDIRDAEMREVVGKIAAMQRDGLTVKQALASDPALPALPSLLKFLKRYPDQEARIKEARAARWASKAAQKPPTLTADQLNALTETVQAGGSILNALAQAAPAVNSVAFYKLMKRDQQAKAAIVAATIARENGPGAVGRTATFEAPRYWTDAEFDVALDAIRHHAGRSLRDVLRAPLMTYPVVYARAQVNADFAARLASAIREHTKRWKLARPQKIKRVYAQNVLRSGLLLDQLYADASKLFHRGLDADIRDDMISEVVLAVLDGRLSRNDVAKGGREVGWSFVKSQGRAAIDSLDRPVMTGNGKISLGDTITADRWSFEDAI